MHHVEYALNTLAVEVHAVKGMDGEIQCRHLQYCHASMMVEPHFVECFEGDIVPCAE